VTDGYSKIDELAEEYIRSYAVLNPVAAISMGIAEPPPGLTDYGREGNEARAEIARRLLASVAKEDITSDRDRIAVASMRDRLGVELDQHETGEWMRELRVFGSPPAATRQVFELLPHSTSEDWEEVSRRMAHVPAALKSFRSALEEGVRRNVVAAKRQAFALAAQTETIGSGYFERYVAEHVDRFPDSTLADHLGVLARAADAAYLEIAHYLRGDYAAAASDEDAFGRERYLVACRRCTGVDLDLDETYAWGWEELHRIQAEMAQVAEQIAPGEGIDGAIELLESDPKRCIEGVDSLVGWLQELMDSRIEDLGASHFDIPEPVRTVEARVAPPGSAAAMYYTPPSADFSRPGRTWYPNLGKPTFPLWVEVSTAHHEGVPGHHLQIGYTRWLGERLNAFQRYRGMVSGHIEGWALYAERLMGELGYLENPDYLLGMLAGQAWRAARVIVDIGMHLKLSIPTDESYHGGEQWTPELAVPFMVAAGRRTEAFMASEVDRYLGWPAQAISYKVGERIWLRTRETVRRQNGATFDPRRFHRRAFELGLVGLGQLEEELTAA
jgi:uncharacterized protein (DUF885 family)